MSLIEYSVQTLLSGQNIGQYLEAKQLDFAQKLDIAQQAISLTETLHKTHLHRDIKPENFIWDPVLKTLHLCDFGLACDISDNETYVDMLGSGTSGYLAPEIDKASGQAVYTKKTDIYALGKTLEDLFEDEHISQNLSDMIKGMTASNPEDRLSDMGQLNTILNFEFAQPSYSNTLSNNPFRVC